MTIGELLKEYRITQRKNQKNFTNNGVILSQSYYSKIEKGAHRITAEDLFDLLHYNNISLWNFVSRLNQSDQWEHYQSEEIHNMMIKAYYSQDKKQLNEIKKMIQKSGLSKTVQEEQELMVDGWIESMQNDPKLSNKNLRQKLKEKLFSSPNYSKESIILYCNFMTFYDFNSNLTISRNIVSQYQNSREIKIQIAIMAIIGNILALAIENHQVKKIDFFIRVAKKIPTSPELFFYKNGFLFFENLAKYQLDKDRKHLNSCNKAINTFKDLGMKKYGEKLARFLSSTID